MDVCQWAGDGSRVTIVMDCGESASLAPNGASGTGPDSGSSRIVSASVSHCDELHPINFLA